MASLLETQRAFRRRLLKADADTARQLVGVYANVRDSLQGELKLLTDRIAEARLAGETVNQSWLFAEQRYRNLLEQSRFAYRRAAAQAAGETIRAQSTVARLGEEAAEALVRSLAPPQVVLSWSQLPVDVIESFVGFASDGSALAQLFDALGPEGAAGIRSSMVRGIGLGYSPRKIARSISDSIGMSLTRAMTISRTELVRSYRAAQADSYRANKDVVVDMMWHAELSSACISCAGMHGTLLGLSGQVIAGHPNCRCSAIPITRPWSELGYAGIRDTNPTIQSGPDWFAGLPSERQAAFLGEGRFAAYQRGVGLREMVGIRNDARWGRSIYTRSAQDALRRAARRARRVA